MSTVGERLMQDLVAMLEWRLQLQPFYGITWLGATHPPLYVFTLRGMLESERSGAQEKKRRNAQDTNSC